MRTHSLSGNAGDGVFPECWKQRWPTKNDLRSRRGRGHFQVSITSRSGLDPLGQYTRDRSQTPERAGQGIMKMAVPGMVGQLFVSVLVP